MSHAWLQMFFRGLSIWVDVWLQVVDIDNISAVHETRGTPHLPPKNSCTKSSNSTTSSEIWPTRWRRGSFLCHLPIGSCAIAKGGQSGHRGCSERPCPGVHWRRDGGGVSVMGLSSASVISCCAKAAVILASISLTRVPISLSSWTRSFGFRAD